MGEVCLVLVFLKARGGLIFNNTEEVQPHDGQLAMVWMGLDCMYRLMAIESSVVIESNTSAEVKNLWLGVFGVSRSEGARL
jgi:hypothetical protein